MTNPPSGNSIGLPIDAAILTIKEEEFQAVLHALDLQRQTIVSRARGYTVGEVPTPRGSIRVAVTRCPAQGNGVAQDVARDVLHDLDPTWVLVVGIAGAAPDEELCLGDVGIAGRVFDFTVEAVKASKSPEYAIGEVPTHVKAENLLTMRAAWEPQLGHWYEIGDYPALDLEASRFYGDTAWQQDARKALDWFVKRNLQRPVAKVVPIACSDKLVKDTEVLAIWKKVARQIRLVEMESAGIHIAARGRGPYRKSCPVLAIRGVSDVVGFKRSEEWTLFACKSAASYANALLRSGVLFAEAGSQATPHGDPVAKSAHPPSRQEHALGPPRYVKSERLDQAADQLEASVQAADSHVIALRGRPGDGKTQVARQIAARFPGAIYIELGVTETTGHAWSEALTRIIQGLSRTPYRARSLEKTISDTGTELAQSTVPLVVLDNADSPIPIEVEVRKLTRHDGSLKVILVGPGARGVDKECALPPPSQEEFTRIIETHLGVSISPESSARRLVKKIGETSGFSALIARCVADDCSRDHLDSDLRSFLSALREGGLASSDDLIDRALSKCWSSLSERERNRLRFVAAFGGEVPESWLPESLAAAGPRSWRMLDRSGLATRQGELVQTLRLHRLAQLWIVGQSKGEVSAEVHQTLVRLVSSPEVADELRSRMGAVPRALLLGVQYVVERGFLDPQAPKGIDDEILLKTFLETCQGSYTGDRYEEHLRFLFGANGEKVASSPPALLGQLVDNARLKRRDQGEEKTPTFLDRLVEGALLALQEQANELPEILESDRQWSAVSAAHHLAKHLVRSEEPGKREKAVELLREILALSEERIGHSSRADLWHLQIVKSTLQLCGSQSPVEDAERVARLQALQERLELARAPRYLRLRIVELLLRVQSISTEVLGPKPRRELVRKGIELCRENSVPRIQADFLVLLTLPEVSCCPSGPKFA